jgi:hypothetical protein
MDEPDESGHQEIDKDVETVNKNKGRHFFSNYI